jgi:DNA-binding MarR family transcriptional regulator
MKYELHQCIGARVRRLSRIIDSYYRKILFDFDITENQMTVLFVLSASGKLEQGKIGEILRLGRSTISRTVRLLEKQHIIQRTSEYRPEVELTGEGKKLVKELLPLWEKLMDNLHNKLGIDGINHIEELEKKLV